MAPSEIFTAGGGGDGGVDAADDEESPKPVESKCADEHRCGRKIFENRRQRFTPWGTRRKAADRKGRCTRTERPGEPESWYFSAISSSFIFETVVLRWIASLCSLRQVPQPDCAAHSQ